MKAQSAIEYLVTYGWMLIAVAVVIGAIYPALSPSCSEESTGFASLNLRLSDFGISSQEELMLSLKNSRPENIEIDVVNITQNGRTRTITPNNEFIAPGRQGVVELKGFNQNQECKELDVQIKHSIGALEGQKVSGTIRTKINMIKVSAPSPVNEFEVNNAP